MTSIFRQLFDRETCTYTYLLGTDDQALLIDPVLEQVDRDLQLVGELGLTLAAVVDTHVHADHVTAAWTLEQRTGCKLYVPGCSPARGGDHTLADSETLSLGSIALETRFTPGHTACSASYVDHANRRVFTGDALLIRGCGRTDFQGGDSEALYRSVHERILSLPPETRIYPGHDYKGRTVSTVAEELAHNPRLGGGRSVEEFVAIMAALDLANPARIDVSVPANLQLGGPV